MIETLVLIRKYLEVCVCVCEAKEDNSVFVFSTGRAPVGKKRVSVKENDRPRSLCLPRPLPNWVAVKRRRWEPSVWGARDNNFVVTSRTLGNLARPPFKPAKQNVIVRCFI